MVQHFTIEDDAMHKKCSTCSGKKTECLQLIQCSYGPCGKFRHVDCLSPKFDRQKLVGEDYFYCTTTCEELHAQDRKLLEARKDPALAKFIDGLEKEVADQKKQLHHVEEERNKVIHAAEVLNQSYVELEEQLKKERADATLGMFSSTALPQSRYHTSSEFQAPQPSTSQNSAFVSALSKSDTWSKIFDKVKIIEATKKKMSEPIDSNPFSLPANVTLTNDEVSQAHALASITLGLSERRKQLPKLPEFNGKGAEWLHFKNIYWALKTEGRFDNREMIAKLSGALKGEALSYTKLWLTSSRPNPDKIMEDLELRFFSKKAVMTDAFESILELPNTKSRDRNSLENLRRAVDGYINICTDVNETAVLAIGVPERVEDKLPDDLLNKWNRLCRHNSIVGNWHYFSNYLAECTLDLKVRVVDRHKPKEVKNEKASAKINVVTSQAGQSSQAKGNYPNKNSNNKQNLQRSPPNGLSKLVGESPRCDYCHCGKSIYRCGNFARAAYDIKLNHCRTKGYCARCLRKGHATIACPNVAVLPKCKVEGCTERSEHTTIMHPPFANSNQIQNTHIRDGAEASLFQVASILIEDSKGNKIPVTAFIDTGSNASIMSHDLYQRLGLKGTSYNLQVSWCAAGVSRSSSGSFKTDLVISPADNPSKKLVVKNIISMKDLELPMQEQNEAKLHSLFPHLKNIKIPEFARQRPQILLGLHHRYLTTAKEVILPPSGKASAIAEKTSLGWVLSCANLPHFNLNTLKAEKNSAVVKCYDTHKISLEQLNQLVKHHLNLDQVRGLGSDEKYLTPEDKRANEILEKTMKLIDGRYHVGLLWKNDSCQLPDNSGTALRRLISTEATLKKKNLESWANDHHKLLLKLGFAREATNEELNPSVPHKRINYAIGFVVVNQNKIPPKPRWVVDTACKHDGVSLNSALLKGPDNLLPLTQALFHFRERKIALCADVEKQFHQVKIIDEDLQCQRYYWRECDASKPPKVYIFTSMLFGPTDSPSKANAVRIAHAKNCAVTYPSASQAALNSMYMDDQFHSENAISGAIKFAKQSIEMFDLISWRMVDFRSNEPEVLANLPADRVNKNMAIELSKDDPTQFCCKVLGTFWNPREDVFEFKQTAEMELRLKCLQEHYHPTKLEILSFIMRIFDSLGLIAHFIVRGRMILQMTWKAQLNWDEHINDEIFQAWIIWLHQFDQIAKLKIPRHYGYDEKVVQIQAHIFSDASLLGYSAVGYFRFVFNDGTIKVQHVMGKARVAPLKEKTVPKLELDGALLGVRLASKMIDQHKRMKISETFLWTDSEIVLKWIIHVHLKLLPYVAPRVSEIRDTFPLKCWNYCPSQQNPADHGTKCTEIDFGDHRNRWYSGPDFLWEAPEKWPKMKASIKFPNEATVAASDFRPTPMELYYAGVLEEINPQIRAKWKNFKRVVAIMLRFSNNLLAKIDGGPTKSGAIEPNELENAEKLILRKVQDQIWHDEIELLMGGKALRQKHSKALISLNPIIGHDGLLRCHTRYATEQNIPYEMRYPIILPNSHETVDAIITAAHEKNLHIGIEATIAQLRGKYWIIAVRQAVKRKFATCMTCKLFRLKPYNVPTGDLPEVRVNSTSRPYEHVGTDCFGPFTIYSGRSYHKKEVNVVLFTCMTTRHIYMRRLESMTTDDMLLAIQEVWTRRGPIITMRSDNGRNYQGCFNFLAEEFKNRLIETFGIKWILNPPYSPQFGAIWERLIRDIKRAMKASMKDRVVHQGTFDCILLQVEDIINSRPLTHVPASPNDDVAITPNLLVKLHPGYPFLGPDEPDENTPGQLKLFVQKAKKFSNQIMLRWSKEYLPVITKHSPKKGPKRDIKVGDLVYYCEPKVHPSNWPKAIVINTYPGRDGYARVADIKLGNGTIIERRSSYRLARLDVDNEPYKVTCNLVDANKRLEKVLAESFKLFALRPEHMKNIQRAANVSEHVQGEMREQKFPLTTSSNKSSLVQAAHQKMDQLNQYRKLEHFQVLEILKALAREPFILAQNISTRQKSSLAREIAEFGISPACTEGYAKRMVKFSIEGGIISFAELLLSFLALEIRPTWIKIQDQAQRAPLVAFALLENERDTQKLIDIAHFQISYGAMTISRPTPPRPMSVDPVTARGLEHAMVKIPFKGKLLKVLCTRLSANDPQFSHLRTKASGLSRAAPMIDTIWMHRFRSYFNDIAFCEAGEWKDFRIVSPKASHDVNPSSEENFEAQLASGMRSIKLSDDAIEIKVVMNSTNANAQPSFEITPNGDDLKKFTENSTQTETIVAVENFTQTATELTDDQPSVPRPRNSGGNLMGIKKTSMKPGDPYDMRKVKTALTLINPACKKLKPKPSNKPMPRPIIVKEEPMEHEDIVEITSKDDLSDLN